MKKLTYVLGLFILISSCTTPPEQKKEDGIFPQVKNVTDLVKTDFVPTLESSFTTESNIIYGATIPFAWNEIKREIGTPLKDFTSKELEGLNRSTSFLNVLKPDEYTTSVEVNGNEIIAKAYFSKSLPFDEPLTKFKESLSFGKSEVESFGFWGSHYFARINYFNSENDFSISLFPKNSEHEIILIMSPEVKGVTSSFTEYLNILHQQKDKRIHFNAKDKVEIPIIEFNLDKSFGQFIGSTFRSERSDYRVIEAYQRNAFILNENGAEVESEGTMVAEASEEAETSKPKPKPKMMIFNKPFVVLLKRNDANYPYFGVYIANDELLKTKIASEK